jgi:hypothetical protein
MLKRLWRRIVERHRRNVAELDQIEMDLAKLEAHLPLLPAFPQKPYKASTIVLFAVLGFFVAFAVWVSFKELVIPLFEGAGTTISRDGRHEPRIHIVVASNTTGRAMTWCCAKPIVSNTGDNYAENFVRNHDGRGVGARVHVRDERAR